MGKSFKFFIGDFFDKDEQNAKILFTRLIMTGEYETTIYPKIYDNQYIVNSILATVNDNLPQFTSNITVIGRGTYNFHILISP